jgi:pyruvate formate lyase activating enzyme
MKWGQGIRRIIEIIVLLSFVIIGILIVWKGFPLSPTAPKKMPLTEAKYWIKLEGDGVQCQLCFRGCTIPEGGRGYCSVRVNKGGNLYTLVYSLPAAIQVDPVEKEPLLHFLPGTNPLCFGTAGCNFKCIFCHNWHPAAKTPQEVESLPLSPEEAVDKAIRFGCQSISSSIWMRYALTSKALLLSSSI